MIKSIYDSYVTFEWVNGEMVTLTVDEYKKSHKEHEKDTDDITSFI